MAYNFWGEFSEKIHWEKLNKSVQPFRLLEYVPMPGIGLNGGDAIGLSIPMRNTGSCAYQEFLQVAALLRTEFPCVMYTCIMERWWMIAHWSRLRRILHEQRGKAFESLLNRYFG